MKIYWNTDARQITFDIESGISAPRYSKLPLELFFQKGTYPNNLDSYLLPEDTVIHAVLKLEGSYNTNTALAAIIGAGFETPELVANPYTGDLNLNTVSIDSLFRQLDNTEEVKCTLVLLYRPANVGDWVVSPRIPFTLENAVATGYEGAPVPVPLGILWGSIEGNIANQTDLINYIGQFSTGGNGSSDSGKNARFNAMGVLTAFNFSVRLIGNPERAVYARNEIIFYDADDNIVSLSRPVHGGLMYGYNKTVTPPGTTGDVNIDELAGTVNFASGSDTLVITNNKVLEGSICMTNISSPMSDMTSVNAVTSNGFITLYAVGGIPSSECRVEFVVFP